MRPADNTVTQSSARRDAVDSAADYLFFVVNSDNPALTPWRHCLRDIDIVTIGRGAELRRLTVGERHLAVEIPDPRLSAQHAKLVRAGQTWAVIDSASKNGTRLDGNEITREPLRDGSTIEAGRSFFRFRRYLPPCAEHHAPRLPAPATLLPALQRAMDRLEVVAESKISILIQGESGTGKEGLARAVHTLSRRSGSFVAVNCGAIPAGVMDSELFGHVRGAFSGAMTDRRGLVREADGGTLFLDEIGDMAPPVQTALLRVLQESEVRPLGANRAIPVDVRIIAATHQDLEALIEEGRFRADLFARLLGHAIDLPPLRERMEDLGLILGNLLGRHAPGRAVTFEREVIRAMMAYPWPYNIRELEKYVAAALAFAHGPALTLEDFPDALKPPASDQPHEADERGPRLVALLQKHRGNVAAVAREMGKARMQIHRWLKHYGIELERFRASP